MRHRSVLGVICGVALGVASGALASTGFGLWTSYMVPGAAHLPGDKGTFWRTDVAILNPHTDHGISVSVRFRQELRDNTSSPAHSYDIPAGGQLLLEDVVWQVFGVEGKGVLHVTSEGWEYFVVTARTYTGAPGTYGQTINGQSWVNLAGDRAYTAGIRNAAQFRTNVGAVNWSGVPVSVLAEVYDATGALKGSKTFALLPWSNEQVSVASFAGTFASGFVRWTCPTDDPEAAWLAYASVVDNTTGDAVFLEERSDDIRTDLDPAYDLGGTWGGMLVASSFTETVMARVFHTEGSVTAYLYDASYGGRVGTLYGTADGTSVTFTGHSDIFDNVHDEIWGTAQVASGGSSLTGTFSGTGSYSGGGSFYFTKQSSVPVSEEATARGGGARRAEATPPDRPRPRR